MTFIFREDTWKHWHQGFVLEMLSVEWCKIFEEIEPCLEEWLSLLDPTDAVVLN